MNLFETIPDDWKNVLFPGESIVDFEHLSRKIQDVYQFEEVFPPKNQLFRSLEVCPFKKVKVVILGQDPYPTAGHAHGLSFSCDENVKPLPKSLHNIFKEYSDDLKRPIPNSGNLVSWSQGSGKHAGGYLFLNTILTVRKGEPLSHKYLGWEKFTNLILDTISNNSDKCVFVLWGKPAQSKKQRIDSSKHLILESAHPSPLSSYHGFFGSKPFSKIHAFFEEEITP